MSRDQQTRRVRAKDLQPVADALTRANTDNPAFRYVFNEPEHYEHDLRNYFTAQLTAARRAPRIATAICTSDTRGAAIWYRQPGPMPMDPAYIRSEGHCERAHEEMDSSVRNIPAVPHLLVSVLTTDPPDDPARADLVRALTQQADRDQLPVWTVTTVDNDNQWYLDHGFQIALELPGTAYAPRKSLLRREPGASTPNERRSWGWRR